MKINNLLILLLLISCTRENYKLTERPIIYKDPNWTEENVVEKLQELNQSNIEETLLNIESNKKFNFNGEKFWKILSNEDIDTIQNLIFLPEGFTWLLNFHRPTCSFSSPVHFLKYTNIQLKIFNQLLQENKVALFRKSFQTISQHLHRDCRELNSELLKTKEHFIKTTGKKIILLEKIIGRSPLAYLIESLSPKMLSALILSFIQQSQIENQSPMYLYHQYLSPFTPKRYLEILENYQVQSNSIDYNKLFSDKIALPFNPHFSRLGAKHLNLKDFLGFIERALKEKEAPILSFEDYEKVVNMISAKIKSDPPNNSEILSRLSQVMLEMTLVYNHPKLLAALFTQLGTIRINNSQIPPVKQSLLPFQSDYWKNCPTNNPLPCLFYARFYGRKKEYKDFCQELAKLNDYHEIGLDYHIYNSRISRKSESKLPNFPYCYVMTPSRARGNTFDPGEFDTLIFSLRRNYDKFLDRHKDKENNTVLISD